MTTYLLNGAQARDRIIAQIRDLPLDSLWDVTIQRHRRKMSADQRAMVYAVVQQIAAARGEEYSLVLQDLKASYWPHEWRVALTTGEPMWQPKTLADKPNAASRAEVSDILNALMAYAADNGIPLDQHAQVDA
jgi:hypothetical protein